jgi:hypothetical protein
MSADLPRLDRRSMLRRTSTGFGALALAGLLGGRGAHGEEAAGTSQASRTHFAPRAKHVIFCYMSGGVSHVDSFDPKPRLAKEAGQPMPMKVERTQFNDNGRIFPSPFAYDRYGECGLEVSRMFPHLGGCADELAIIRSMTSPLNEHAQGNYFAHSGFPFLGHPSAGAWVHYGLGDENENLPGFVVLQSGGAVAPHGGVGLFSSGFLPAQHQASIMQVDQAAPIPHIRPRERADSQRARLRLIDEMDRLFAQQLTEQDPVEAAIQNYEKAFRMQTSVPELCDLRGESAETLRRYGVDRPDRSQSAYARQCLVARRLVERGVRFIELSCLAYDLGGGNGANPWDHHGSLEEGHRRMAEQVDQPIAALIQDLKARGLLAETLIVWAGEFGRTPFSQGSNGRDHNPFGFTVWMAGGGIRGGTVHGATDEYGYHAVEKPCTFYDMWATVLHQLGLDHERLTYRYGGRDFRLTDVHGHVLKDILA